MGFDLYWTEEKLREASQDFSQGLADDLRCALRDKRRQIKWSKNMAELSKRFQDIISLDSVIVAELRFSSGSSEYRALLIVIPEEKTLFYYTTVPKKGSYQERQLELIRENSDRIKSYFSEKY